MLMYKGIDHVQIAAPSNSEDECRAFFSGLLGMPEIPKPENLRKRGGVWFRCGSHELHIGVQEPFSPATKAHPAFAVDSISELREKLNKLGIDIKEGELLEGAERFHIHDPFGNRLEFLERQD
ncbi:glyoxalase [Bacillus haynesii]|uniref:VOC family protein n=1 Tax=Bacillus haynesii TaxID=1925021 RepID=UPI00227DAE02|nr:VOC family protein [Bacillus haynesii]MCY8225547.1 glyoxalase [Bacillus haynesii]MEC1446913.1 glyoxalase [Bacillus haynesii]